MITVQDIIVRTPTPDEHQLCLQWPVWTCAKSSFNYTYDERETCLILQGKVRVTSPDASLSVNFKEGNLVIFPKGLTCIWHIEEDVRKHYKFE